MNEEPSTPSDASSAALQAFMRRAREDRQKTAQILNHPTLEPEQRARRTAIAGFLIGGAASALFAILSQEANIVLLPGVPLYPSMFNPLFNILVITAIGTLFCLLAVSSLKIQNRVAAGLLALVGLIILYFFYRLYGNVLVMIINGLAFSLAAFALLLIPIFLSILGLSFCGMLVRWAVHAQVKYFYQPIYAFRRILPPLALLALAVLGSTLFILSKPEQKAVRKMDGLVRQSLAARTEKSLPAPVRNMWGTQFLPYARYARGRYYLVAWHNPLPTRVKSDGTPYLENISVTARLQSGYWFTCEFHQDGTIGKCSSDYKPPHPGLEG